MRQRQQRWPRCGARWWGEGDAGIYPAGSDGWASWFLKRSSIISGSSSRSKALYIYILYNEQAERHNHCIVPYIQNTKRQRHKMDMVAIFLF
jgi:hypothetical protein